MRILIAANSLFKLGGMQRSVIDLANNLVNRGHEVTLVGNTNKDAFTFYPVDTPVQVINIAPWHKAFSEPKRKKLSHSLTILASKAVRPINRNVYKNLKWQVKYDRAAASWRAFCLEQNPDLVIATLPNTFTVLVEALQNTQIPVIVNNRNNPFKDYTPDRYSNHPEDVTKRNLAPEIAAANIVLLTEFKQFFSAKVQEKTYVIPNFVRPVPKQEWAQPGRDDQLKTIITTGRYTEVKDHQTLIEAFATVHKDFPQWQIKIFGEGELRGMLSDLIRERGLNNKVFLCGHTDRLFDELRLSHLFAFPTRFEGWGHSLTEAMAHGLPAVGFDDASGVNSLIQHEETGFLADGQNRIESFAFYLSKLMGDGKLRHTMGQAGIEFVRTFEPDYVYDLWENSLKKILEDFHAKKSET